MPNSATTFLGIDAGSGRKPFTYVAIDENRALLTVGGGDAADVLAFAAGQTVVLAAISPPARSENQRSGADGETPLPRRRLNAPRQLSLDESAPPTPAAPVSLRSCFELLAQMEKLDFKAYPAGAHPRQWLEAPSYSGFHALLGLAPFPAAALEGRIQRQLLLSNLELGVPNAMDFFEEITRFKILHGHLPYEYILPLGELNAWLAAATAWAALKAPDTVRQVGSLEEGSLYYTIPPADD